MKKARTQKVISFLELDTFNHFGIYFRKGIAIRLSNLATTEKANTNEDYKEAVTKASKDCYVLQRYKSLQN